MMKLKIVKTYGDAEKIAKLAERIWREHYTSIIGSSQVEYMLRKYQSADAIFKDMTENGYIYYMIKEDGLCGYCGAQVLPDEVFLSKLYIDSNFRGKGHSKLFLNELCRIAKKENIRCIRLNVSKDNPNSIAAYKKMGFEVVDSINTDIGSGFFMDDYVMRKTVE